YGSWIERLRESPKRSRSRTRKLMRGIAIDFVLLAVLFIGLSVEFPRLVRWLDASVGLSLPAARAVVLVFGAVLAAVPLIALVRMTHLLGMAVSVQALPMPEEKKVDLARAP